MKANVIHGDFNPCGGAERLSLGTMHALLRMGIDFDLTTLKSPDISKLENSYGKKLVSVMKSIKKINVINIIEELRQQQLGEEKRHRKDYNYDITINTNGDAAPYFHPSFSKDNAITYCHFPSTKDHIECENIDYLKTDLGMTEGSDFLLDDNDHEDITKPKKCKSSLTFSKTKEYFEILKYGYWNLMRNSKIITNSDFTRRAIINAFGSDNILILSPPIDIETFRNVSLLANGNYERGDMVLVISRIAPHKKIENAIKLAKILKDNNIGKGMKIIGNLYYYYLDYYSELKRMVLLLGLSDYITFEINASLDKLLSCMRESRIYFHPMVGEHFGMAVLEAMAAGLIPVVPNEGGITEFVPQRYQFNTIDQAAEIIIDLFNHLPKIKRIDINADINKFSNSHYIGGFQTILKELLSRRKT
ncbi:MAG TPA: glycosyltransferase [Nitrososphaeraceae archaeon]|nr:glycosyltransferase [Nitrososphaeraceae archaeon]